ncbi:MAG: NADH-quinone oxidoreductase subunit K, partial [Isosphaeraceae bacterium]
LADEHRHLLLVPASLATVWTGFLMLTTRKKAIMQVLGYLVLENGIFLFGLLLLEAMPLLVEAGILLDLFTGVFVMGIIVHHISREFASTSTEHLSELRE